MQMCYITAWGRCATSPRGAGMPRPSLQRARAIAMSHTTVILSAVQGKPPAYRPDVTAAPLQRGKRPWRVMLENPITWGRVKPGARTLTELGQKEQGRLGRQLGWELRWFHPGQQGRWGTGHRLGGCWLFYCQKAAWRKTKPMSHWPHASPSFPSLKNPGLGAVSTQTARVKRKECRLAPRGQDPESEHQAPCTCHGTDGNELPGPGIDPCLFRYDLLSPAGPALVSPPTVLYWDRQVPLPWHKPSRRNPVVV